MAGNGDWRPDPSGRHEYRWWDGERWTDLVGDGGRTSTDPWAGSADPRKWAGLDAGIQVAAGSGVVPGSDWTPGATWTPQPAWGPGGAGVARTAAPVASTNGLAIASLVLGIVWIYWIGSILAVIFGHIALRQCRERPQEYTGRGMAIAGVVLGYVGIGILALLLAIAMASLAAV